MKYFSRSLHLVLTFLIVLFCFIFLCFSLAACSAKRSVIKSVSESATASVSDSRLTFYRTLDSLSRQFNLSADSIIMIFPNASSPEFPSEFPSRMEGHLETPSDSQALSHTPKAHKRIRNASRSASASRPTQVPSYLLPPSEPTALKIYGLHIADNSEEKSVASADLKDSVAVATQAHKLKSTRKQSSKPSSAPYYILIIFIITIVIYIVHRLRRLIK